MLDGCQLAVSAGAQRHLLDGMRTVARDGVLLSSRQNELDRTLELLCRQRRNEDMDPRSQRGAKRAAHEWRNHPHVVVIHAKRRGHLLLHVIDPLRLVIQSELVSIPS